MSLNIGRFITLSCSWAELKAVISGNKLILQSRQKGDQLHLFAIDEPIVHLCALWLETLPHAVAEARVPGDPAAAQAQNDADVAEYNTVFAATANAAVTRRTPSGLPITAQSGYAYIPESTVFKGYKYTIPFGTHSFFDEVLTDVIYLQGGNWWIAGAALGDYIEFSVVDKDDVLGAFALYGLTVGVDVLELGKYVRTLYVKPGDSEGEKRVSAPALVMQGLYLRLTYHSVGLTNVVVAPCYLWHEV